MTFVCLWVSGLPRQVILLVYVCDVSSKNELQGFTCRPALLDPMLVCAHMLFVTGSRIGGQIIEILLETFFLPWIT